MGARPIVFCTLLILAPVLSGCLEEPESGEPSPVWLMIGRSCETREWQAGTIPSISGLFQRDDNVSDALAGALEPEAVEHVGAFRARLGGGAACGQWDGWVFFAHADQSPGRNWSQGGDAWVRFHDDCLAPGWMLEAGLDDHWGNNTQAVAENRRFSDALTQYLVQEGYGVHSAYVYLFPPGACPKDALLDVAFVDHVGGDWLPIPRHLAHPIAK